LMLPNSTMLEKTGLVMEENGYEYIYQDLRSKILNEVLAPNQKLSENNLSREYNCSRTPIREVLKRLENDGFIIIKPKSGTYIRRDTKKEIVELVEVRAYLEALAFHLCLTTMTDSEYKRLEKIKQEMDNLVKQIPIDIMRFARIHYNFHHVIVKASRNDLLLRYFERLNLKSSYLFYERMDEKTGKITEQEHGQILIYLKNRDLRGIEYMRDHLLRKYDISKTVRT
jgi:GntR family transcriptional regulator, rspAB operon transcriptional repressor